MKAFYEARSEPFFIGEMTHYVFPLHVHGIVEMVCLLRGECEMEIDGKPAVLRAGDAAIAFPLVPHSFEKVSEDVSGLAAFFSADLIPEFAPVFHTQLPDQPVARGIRENPDFLLAAEKLMKLPEDSPSRLAYLHLLLANLLSVLRFHQAAAFRERDLGTKVVRYIFDHACENISLSSAAHDLGISESHLSHLFAQQFHVNFRRFINAIRIDKAIMLMRDPYMTLTQVCYQCGYDNARTFRRSFIRETGQLPAAYLRSARESAKENGAEK